jgi:outer membrane lipoprotein
MRWLLILILATSLHGCSSQPVRPIAERLITPQQASSMRPADIKSLVQWGGVIIESRNLRETTEIQILAYPLDENGRPDTDADSIGRFIAQKPGYLEGMEYRPGREVTASGKVSAIRQGRVAERDPSFPILLSDDITLWPKHKPRSRPRIRFGVGASSAGGGFGSIGISF